MAEAHAGTSAGTPFFSVIILNWNGRHLVEECLDSVLAQSFRSFETLVVDNGSTDGSVPLLREKYGDRARIVALDANRGYVGGYNAGIPESKGRYVILLNNDTRVDPGWLQALSDACARHPGAGMFTPKVLEYDRPGTIDNTGHVMYRDGLNRGRSRLETDDGRFDAEEEVFYPSGCAGVYRKDMLDRVGLFDETFFAFGEDTDLGLKGRVAGYPCYYVPDARVYHKYSATWGKYSPGKVFFVERNRLWILFKFFPLREICLSPFFTAWRYFVHFRGILEKRGASYRFTEEYPVRRLLLTVLKADICAISGLPHILAERWRLRKVRTVSGKEFRRFLERFGMTAEEVALKD